MRRQGSAYFRKTIQEDKVSKKPGSRVGTEGKGPVLGDLLGLWGKGGIMEERKEREGGWCTQQRCRLLVDKEGRIGAGSGASPGHYLHGEAPRAGSSPQVRARHPGIPRSRFLPRGAACHGRTS